MRKVTSEACRAFEIGAKVVGDGVVFNSGNTKVTLSGKDLIGFAVCFPLIIVMAVLIKVIFN